MKLNILQYIIKLIYKNYRDYPLDKTGLPRGRSQRWNKAVIAIEGFSLRVSGNALMLNGVNPKTIPGFIKIIPSGTLQVFKKINEGYTYLIAV